MYISPIIIILIIIAVIYYYLKIHKKVKAGTRTHAEIYYTYEKLPNNFSYKLKINLIPNWENIYKKCSSDESEERQNEFIKKMEEKIKDADFAESVLWGRNYDFTEFYESTSGLITRFQEITFPHQNFKKTFSIVNEFGESGDLIENAWYSPLGVTEEERKHGREKRNKYCLEITERSVKNFLYRDFRDGDSTMDKNELFNFPLYEAFNFLLRFNLRYGKHGVIKWPDTIEDLLKVENIEYDVPKYGNYLTDVKIVDIESRKKHYEELKKEGFEDADKNYEEDKDFFQSTGNPKMTYSTTSGSFTADVAWYRIELEIFEPSEGKYSNDRRIDDHPWSNFIRTEETKKNLAEYKKKKQEKILPNK
jgi:hypothetical protein